MLGKKEYKRAINHYTEIIKSAPNDIEVTIKAHFNRGITCFNQKIYTGSLGDFKKIIELNPANKEILIKSHFYCGEAYLQIGRLDLQKFYRKKVVALEAENGTTTDFQYNEKHKKITITEKIDDDTSSQETQDNSTVITKEHLKSDAYFRRANNFFLNKQYENAITDYQESLKLHNNTSNKGKIFLSLGNAYFNLGQYENAIKYYKDAIKSKNEAVVTKAYFNRANAYFLTGDCSNAVNDYKKVISSTASSKELIINTELIIKAYLCKGNAYAGLKQYKKALSNYKLAITIDTENAQLTAIAKKSYRFLKNVFIPGQSEHKLHKKEQLIFDKNEVNFDMRLLDYDKSIVDKLNACLSKQLVGGITNVELALRDFAKDSHNIENIQGIIIRMTAKKHVAKKEIIINNLMSELKNSGSLECLGLASSVDTNFVTADDIAKNTSNNEPAGEPTNEPTIKPIDNTYINAKLIKVLKYINAIRNKVVHKYHYKGVKANERDKVLLQYIFDKEMYPIAKGVTFYGVLQAFDNILLYSNEVELANFVKNFEQFVEEHKSELPLLTELIPQHTHTQNTSEQT